MRKLQVKYWQDMVIALLGAWFAASPWLLQLELSTHLIATSVALGVALLLLAIGSLLAPRKWERWAEAAVGLGVAASPWLAGYADDPIAWRNAVATGLVSTLLAIWVMLPAGWRPRKSVLRGTDEMAH
jgi:SPW repeat